jgi:hypothetical protein
MAQSIQAVQQRDLIHRNDSVALVSLRSYLLLRYFYPKRYEDIWGFSVHPIISTFLKYSFLKILYYDREFLI